MSLSAKSLKQAQLSAVNRMLAFNQDLGGGATLMNGNNDDSEYYLPPAGSSTNQWKILIYDTECRSIISPLLSVSQLRKRGVTLHLLLESKREPIPDVPAVYFVRPTKENLAIIAQDCAKQLYGRAHINFVTKLDRSLMEEFARAVVQSQALEQVASVHDQYLDYVCMEKSLFSLHKKDSYVLYNGSGMTDETMEAAMTDIAYGLFSVVATLGYVPIIRCPKGGAPEMVARKLNKMIAEHPTLLRAKSSSRPLLVVMDRNSDLITPIQHSSTYQALIDDLLKHNANRVEFNVTMSSEGNNARPPKQIPKRYDLDPDEDPFYSRYKFNPFPEAIEQNGVELQEVTRREQQIRSKAGDTGTGDFATSGASDLATAVDSLPALLDRKKQLEIHTSILQAVMNEVASRDVPQFFELESTMATGTFKNDPNKAKAQVMELVTDPAKGSVEDKVRLVMVYALATSAKSADIEEVAQGMQQTLETRGSAINSDGTQRGLLDKSDRNKLAVGMRAIEYVKQMRSMAGMMPMSEALQSSDGGSAMLSSFMKSATTQATGLLAKASEKVGSMLGKTHKNHATRVVENLCEMKPNTEDDLYLYLDPKVKGDVDVQALRTMARAPVREVIAFMIGGGCYGEYQNLQMLSNERRTINYGATELVDACKFVAQLGQL